MLKDFFIPTKTNNYTPHLLKRSAITVYTLILLVFNIVTANIASLQAAAEVDPQSLVTLHNQEREKNGLGDLTINSKLVRSAQAKANAMLASDCWDHYCPNGKSPWEFFDQYGYEYIYAGENLAEGFNSNEKVFNAWMNSKTHRENILRAEFTEIGIAIAYGKFQGIENNAVIVVHFGATKETAQLPTTNSQNTNVNTDSFQIISPQQDSIINSNTPDIVGKNAAGTIKLTEDGKSIGSSIAKDGMFIYKVPKSNALVEGEHSIKAESTKTKESDTVDFTVDTIAPELSSTLTLDSVTSGKDEIATITVQASEDTAVIETNTTEFKFAKIGSTIWRMNVPVDELNKYDTISMTAFDQANNKISTNFPLAKIKGEVAESLEENNPTRTLHNIVERIGIRRIVNIVFILIIITLLLIDYYALTQTNLPIGVVRTKAQYHLSVFIIILVISFAGGTAGELLKGTKT